MSNNQIKQLIDEAIMRFKKEGITPFPYREVKAIAQDEEENFEFDSTWTLYTAELYATVQNLVSIDSWPKEKLERLRAYYSVPVLIRQPSIRKQIELITAEKTPQLHHEMAFNEEIRQRIDTILSLVLSEREPASEPDA